MEMHQDEGDSFVNIEFIVGCQQRNPTPIQMVDDTSEEAPVQERVPVSMASRIHRRVGRLNGRSRPSRPVPGQAPSQTPDQIRMRVLRSRMLALDEDDQYPPALVQQFTGMRVD